MNKINDAFVAQYSRRELLEMSKVEQIGPHGEWTREQIIMLALNSGSESNYQRITDPNVEESMRMTPARIDALLSRLSEKDWRFVQSIWDLNESYYGQVAEVNKRLTGVRPKKIPHRPMWSGTPAFVTGGYFRLYYEPSSNSKQADIDAVNQMLSGSSALNAAGAQVGNGATKSRLESAGGATVQLSFSSITRQLRETSRFIALAEMVSYNNRLMRHPEVIAAMNDTGNANVLNILRLHLQNTASGPIYNTDATSWAFRTARNHFVLSRLGFNLKTVILQVTGLSQSAVVIGKVPLARGMLKYFADARRMVDRVTTASALMSERMSTFQKDIYDFRDAMKAQGPVQGRYDTVMDWISKVSFWPITAMQFYVVDMPTWVGAYDAAVREGKSETDAAYIADRMVVRAQGSGQLSDRSLFESGTLSSTQRQSDIVKSLTPLAGYMINKMNRANVQYLKRVYQIREADSPALRVWLGTKLAFDLAILYAGEAVMMGLLYEWMDDDEEYGDLAQFIASETASTMIGGIPIARDMFGAYRGFEGGFYGSVTGQPASFTRQLLQGEIDDSFLRSGLDIVGTATGLPTTQTYRVVEQFLGEDQFDAGEMLMGSNPLTR